MIAWQATRVWPRSSTDPAGGHHVRHPLGDDDDAFVNCRRRWRAAPLQGRSLARWAVTRLPVWLCLLKSRKRRASVALLVPRPYRRRHDRTSVRCRFSALVPCAQPRLTGTRTRCSATPGDRPASATPWPASAVLHRPVLAQKSNNRLKNRFADEACGRRFLIIRTRRWPLLTLDPARVRSTMAFARSNCRRR